MLPPVPKIAATDAAYGTMISLTPRSPVKETLPPQTSAPLPENSGSLFARAAIASLTSEFQLSRSTAVLAEALGKLMNLPRRDGEAVETYVTRLTEALRALPASQRLALEQQVGKALQGLTLSMLAEILKQPTGPDAARLALLIELSRYRGMDLAAKAVVSSYQQNNSAAPAPAQAAQPKQQNAPSQNADSRPSPAATAQTAQATNSAVASRLLPLLIGPLALGGAAMKATMAALAAQLDLRPTFSTPAADTHDTPPNAVKPDGRAENTARPLPSQTGSVTKEVSSETRPANPPRAETGGMRPALPHREAVKTEQKEIRTAFAPPSGPLADDAETMNNLLLAATAGKLPVKATSTQGPLPAQQGVAQQALDDQPAEKSALATAAARPSGEETETVAHRPEAQPLPRAVLDPEARMAMLEQSASQSLVAAALVKEGTPLPLIAYPPADEDYEQETPPRGGGPFSEEEAEGEAEAGAENSDGQDDTEERIAANDTTDEQESTPAAASDDSAENYYLKMSGML
ncbi:MULTISPECIES: hypothetical protein [unclassified Agrobacterium]|uniref:hypothetical protein n=1 Tax=unclassified Agrobacterium TaxID=2632611 RepID=UPI002447B04C|nr:MULTISPECIES: hypothetical protein [unclassified Agrobacterium]MDH0615047.1 hypothetical protein [Agrobacterium sp. GD03872]MDH0698501.1 hypothetical protein [Agrobacterium sp. GD03871]MDH1060430.1 hypothetical protein [Agrobacterium sp. GD03992]MDH2212346.1 hypothetical protein [Agrobacterium sp. GD03643]MDH2220510.1 hypothetical protein [Agrobacterium sp. GD03638]